MIEIYQILSAWRVFDITLFMEVSILKINKIISKIKPPCSKYPYKLGLVHTLVNPCPQCKENNYALFKQFQKNNRL